MGITPYFRAACIEDSRWNATLAVGEIDLVAITTLDIFAGVSLSCSSAGNIEHPLISIEEDVWITEDSIFP